MAAENLAEQAGMVAEKANELAVAARALAEQAATTVTAVVGGGAPAPEPAVGPFWYLFTIFVLAVFVGYYVVWRVTPALHSPLMAVTNAISSVIIVGALIAAGPAHFSASQVMGFFAVILASVNIFGGFIVTQRMLAMFKKKTK
ncbi:NAD(P) transhydrogenase subunit alpha part 2 [uncultured Alphaproteobacteria bacterium]|uniref:proton-translocating NAD(P)(+) transhydrogenase n=1 Tax=uncultured Alphaproteobacteria bacterium TaxID=91750 RepID=A0A212JEZ0_9PROT|nr:NAD(P) transhydrogenase subunit alpha part 2 [uncultured Alphaproteobacteria bacterium]